MIRRGYVLLSFTLGFVLLGKFDGASVPGGQPDTSTFGLDIGYVRRGIVYALGVEQRVEKGLYRARLYQGDLHAKPGAVAERSLTIRSWYTPTDLIGVPWRITADTLWGWSNLTPNGGPVYTVRFPWEDLPLLDADNEKKGEAALRKKYEFKEDNIEVAWGTESSFLVPASEKASELRGGGGPPLEQGEMEVCILPTASKRLTLFFQCEGRMFVYRAARDEKLDWEFKAAETLPAAFRESFLVYGTPEAPYFITRSGRVFHCVKGDKGARKIEPLWDDAQKPVKAVLTDVDTNRTFVLGPDFSGPKRKRFWFELAPKPKAQLVDEMEWPTEEGFSRPLRGRMEFALYLKKLKQLDSK